MQKIPIRSIKDTPKGPASTARFSIRDVGDLLAGKDMVQKLHRHDFFFILALKNAIGTHEIDFETYTIFDHSVFFMRPGQVHQLELKAGSTGYLMEFNSAFYHPVEKRSSQRLQKASNKNYCQLDADRFDKLLAILKYIFHEYCGKQEGQEDIIKANLSIFLIELTRQSRNLDTHSSPVITYTQERFEEFLGLLDNNITTHKQVSEYTQLMNVSAYQLNQITKATIGKTASELITDHIILEAKRFLLATPNQIKDISDHLGYEDTSYFIRFFKKQTGHSPESFRRKFG
jgi:AraC family transcriptional activator of pobA